MNRSRPTIALAGLATLALLTGCGGDADAPATTTSAPGAETTTVTLLTHDSFELSDEDTAALAALGITVDHVKIGDGGVLVNQLILTKDAPLGDVVYGIDNTFATRAIDEGVFTDYVSDALPDAAADLRIGGDALTPIDQGEVCVNYDKTWFTDQGVTVPETLEDLADPAYQDLLVVTNPATSTPGLSFLFATVGAFGEDGFLDYWTQLRDNGVKIVDSWEDAYYVDFSGGGENGPRPLVLSYGSSPAYTIGDDGESTTGSLDATCFRQVEYAGILAGAENPEGAATLIDYMLSDDFQAALPESVYMYPVNPDVALPEDFARFGPLSDNPIEVDPALISEHRDEWIQSWTDTVIG
ncbi:MAG: thiamine ABC transporter substrate-binding protein [Cellulomonadaceae bacterium]